MRAFFLKLAKSFVLLCIAASVYFWSRRFTAEYAVAIPPDLLIQPALISLLALVNVPFVFVRSRAVAKGTVVVATLIALSSLVYVPFYQDSVFIFTVVLVLMSMPTIRAGGSPKVAPKQATGEAI